LKKRSVKRNGGETVSHRRRKTSPQSPVREVDQRIGLAFLSADCWACPPCMPSGTATCPAPSPLLYMLARN
jgi:hypothetical protein